MNEQLLLVTGLPGCGKTAYLEQLARVGWRVFDDFKDHARNNSPRFRDSRHYETLLAALGEGRRCVVADIDFCDHERRKEAEVVLRQDSLTVRFGWLFFENSFERCEANIRQRNRPSLNEDLRKLQEYSKVYSIPYGSQVLPVLGCHT
ncbi:MAG: AAA family ATPase [Acidobacteria bacterium]|nr:AAA family ATPase [Acidobacteriota bacterium]